MTAAAIEAPTAVAVPDPMADPAASSTGVPRIDRLPLPSENIKEADIAAPEAVARPLPGAYAFPEADLFTLITCPVMARPVDPWPTKSPTSMTVCGSGKAATGRRGLGISNQ